MKEKQKDNASTESEKTIERGKDAVKAHEKIFDDKKGGDKKNKDKEKDAEQWHNEG